MKRILLLLTMLVLLAACGTTQNNSAQELPEETDSEENQGGSNNNNNGDDNEAEEENSNGEEQKKDTTRERFEDNTNENQAELSSSLEYSDDTFLFTVKNNLDEDAEITFSSGKEYDYMVYDAEGVMVKQHSEGRMYTQAIQEILLPVGDTLTYTANYEEVASGLSKGEYTIEFVFADPNHYASAKETFQVD
ncbi:BsuPI-related putative proteinase inhibitor [Sutcliffiella deserti]|uniref:BsuPI-related putative proteinase inhibitor n=1 Tax=Sutcliffiella deserti TaxID=2875501 RepID=UPI001CBC8211|nr:BsuPI-related putative proteinase inhibitor [Sutcliffiella deserti]